MLDLCFIRIRDRVVELRPVLVLDVTAEKSDKGWIAWSRKKPSA